MSDSRKAGEADLAEWGADYALALADQQRRHYAKQEAVAAYQQAVERTNEAERSLMKMADRLAREFPQTEKR